jgi:hypothetical protein
MIERFREQRDVHAAIHLLGCMLNSSTQGLEARRKKLTGLKNKLQKTLHISMPEKVVVVRSYREIIG